ncbi:MAG: ACP S-malonyltransferase [Pseudomonadota bacterium]
MDAVLICPGRGTYNAGELGSLARSFPNKTLLAELDDLRATAGQPTLSVLDGADTFDPARHTRGDNAAALIFAATYGDWLSIDTARVRIVAVTGNSMGWYSALVAAGAASVSNGFRIANTMGQLMHKAAIGGQLVYPFMDETWQPNLARKAALLDLVAEIDERPGCALRLSIDLGGMLVLAGNAAGLAAFEGAVPRQMGRYPFRLLNHAAFHTDLQAPVAARGQAVLGPELFGQPNLPLIDGRGGIWWPGATSAAALRDYTLGPQVTQTYDFTRAIAIAAREFAPDLFIVTGPGTTLGGAVAQSLILADWRGMGSKEDFQARQTEEPVVAAMGRADQRALVAL